MPTHVREVTTDEGWEEAVPIVRQLWSDADEEFVHGWRDEDGYRLFGLYELEGDGESAADEEADLDPDGEASLVAVAGVSIQRVLHHERHLWVHDFVVDEPRRGEGLGGELLAWLDEWARERDCENLALACHGDNDAGRAFYEAEGLEVWGQVMERGL
ncbi:GNAT family N-acetyltransferase [Halosimplex amylolyticum]|uniref:GNAT family N-acetyltransferase n=1 Tax=Halosimplex amylolyticum TaxID=3396616 RepID=UPI003F556A0F